MVLRISPLATLALYLIQVLKILSLFCAIFSLLSLSPLPLLFGIVGSVRWGNSLPWLILFYWTDTLRFLCHSTSGNFILEKSLIKNLHHSDDEGGNSSAQDTTTLDDLVSTDIQRRLLVKAFSLVRPESDIGGSGSAGDPVLLHTS